MRKGEGQRKGEHTMSQQPTMSPYPSYQQPWKSFLLQSWKILPAVLLLALFLFMGQGVTHAATQNTTGTHATARGFQILGPFTFKSVQFSGTASRQEVESAAIANLKRTTFTFTNQGLLVRDDYGTRYASVSAGSNNGSQISYSFINLTSNVFFTGTLRNGVIYDAVYQWGFSGGTVVNGGNYGYANVATVEFSSPVQTF
jgi:hypothetical protein